MACFITVISGHDKPQSSGCLLEAALKAADKTRAPLNRDALIKEFMSAGEQLTHDAIVKRNRAVTA